MLSPSNQAKRAFSRCLGMLTCMCKLLKIKLADELSRFRFLADKPIAWRLFKVPIIGIIPTRR